MYCPKCGRELKENAKFCTKCGCQITRRPSAEEIAQWQAYKKAENAGSGMSGGSIAGGNTAGAGKNTSLSGQRSAAGTGRSGAGTAGRGTAGRTGAGKKPQTKKTSKVPAAALVLILVAALAVFGGKKLLGGRSMKADSSGKAQQEKIEEESEKEAAREEAAAKEAAMNIEDNGDEADAESESQEAQEDAAPVDADETEAETVREYGIGRVIDGGSDSDAADAGASSGNEEKAPGGDQRFMGWYEESEGWRYYNGDGSYQRDGWFEDTDHRWYYFDEDGYMMTDTLTPDGFRLGSDGAMIAEAQADAQTAPAEVPASANAGGARTTDGFMIPDSSSRYISGSDLEGFTQWEARVARNEIYARHGRKFNSDELQQYFNSQSWYNGTISANSFNDNVLSAVEKANIKTIEKYEKKF
jgi:hypothetical protein